MIDRTVRARRWFGMALSCVLLLCGCASIARSSDPATATFMPTAADSSADRLILIDSPTPDAPTRRSTPTVVPPTDADYGLLPPDGAVPQPISPTPTPTPVGDDLGILLPTLPAFPAAINGLPVSRFVVLPPDVIAHVRQIYAHGQTQGRDARAFSKLGDSTIENPHFLARFDGGPYHLGDYAALQPVIDHFAGSHGRQGVAVIRGLHSWSVFDPLWADDRQCQPAETILDCELRLHRASVLFVRLGSNDVGRPADFEANMRRLVQTAIDAGVIPILGTKADRHDGPGNLNNAAIRRVAADMAVPLWDFDLVAGTLPGRGLDLDGVHMTAFFAHDYRQPQALRRGYGLMNLTALMMLDAVWRAGMGGG